VQPGLNPVEELIRFQLSDGHVAQELSEGGLAESEKNLAELHKTPA